MQRINTDYSDELKVIRDKYCIGCGVCTVYDGFEIDFDTDLKYNVKFTKTTEIEALKVLQTCPFSGNVPNENQLASEFLTPNKMLHHPELGYSFCSYIGHVSDESMRLSSSSGGIITWLLIQLLKSKTITHVIHVRNTGVNKPLFEYVVSSSEAEIIAGASTKYYPVEMSAVIKTIQNVEGNYVVVALPCFTKGLRLLQRKYPVFKQRIKYIISPICGHLKTANYANFLAWQAGINADELTKVNFRKKIPNLLASQYGTEFLYNRGQIKKNILASSFKMGQNWGHGMFKYNACDYCDDIVGELADLSVGDAWIKKYIRDYKGNSVVVSRNSELDIFLKKGWAEGQIKLEKVSNKIVRETQKGGIRNKRNDLAYRLYMLEKRNQWYPPKRVTSSRTSVSLRRRIKIRLRIKLSYLSHKLYKKARIKNDLNVFFNRIGFFLCLYTIIDKGFYRFLKIKIKKML